MSSEETIEQLKKLVGVEDEQEALTRVARVLDVAAQQNAFLSNMASLTLVIGPQGLGYYNASPVLMDTEEGLDVLEQAIQDFQRYMLNQRKALKVARKQKPEEKVSPEELRESPEGSREA